MKMPPSVTYRVRIVYDDRTDGTVSGPFSSMEAAEQFAIAAIARSDVQKVTIEEVA